MMSMKKGVSNGNFKLDSCIRIALAMVLVVVLMIFSGNKVYAYYSYKQDIDCFVYTLRGENEYCQTVLQRKIGGWSEGYIEAGERLMVVSKENRGATFAGTVTLHGQDIKVMAAELIGIDEFAERKEVLVEPIGSGNIATITPVFDDDIPGTEAGVITSWSALFDIYEFKERTNFRTYDTGCIKFGYEVNAESGGHGTASPESEFGLEGTEISINAVPDEGYRFMNWEILSGNTVLENPDSSTTIVTLGTTDVEVRANFEAIAYKIIADNDGHGKSYASSSSGIIGDEVTLSAEPDEGYRFVKWELVSGKVELADPGSSTTTFMIGTTDVEVRAVFEATAYQITANSDGHGKVYASKSEGTVGDKVTLSAEPDKIYKFKEWKVISGNAEFGDLSSPTTSFTIRSSDVEVKAIFERMKKSITLSGLDPKNGKDTVLTLYWPGSQGSYNGKTHVWNGEKLSSKQAKHKCADLDMDVEGLPETVTANFVCKNTKNASDEKAYYFVKLNVNENSSSYIGLSKDEKRKLKKAVRKGNKLLRKEKNRVYFTIDKLDLGEFVFDKEHSSDSEKVFTSINKSGDKLTLKNKRSSHWDSEASEMKSASHMVLYASILGNEAIIPEKNYRKLVVGDTIVLVGKEQNLTGIIKTQ